MLTAVAQVLLANLGNATKDLGELDVYRPSLFTLRRRPAGRQTGDAEAGLRRGGAMGRERLRI